jgi:hypothetical protein
VIQPFHQHPAARVWNPPRLFALVLLAVALILGASLRFRHLTMADLDADEGTTWAAAIAPSFGAVAAAEQRLEALGKLPLYHLMLHAWIDEFGDSMDSMRTMSAIFGTIAIVLMFAAVREICVCLVDEPAPEFAEMTGAFAALIFATNAAMVVSSRTLRMYPLVMSAELVQIFFFARAQRYGRLLNYAGVAIFTALMVAFNFSASFLLATEASWLAALLLSKWAGARIGPLAIFRTGFAVVAGLALLAPMLMGRATVSAQAIRAGWLDFIGLQPIWWPYRALRTSVEDAALFWVLVALCAFGVWRQWHPARPAPGFFMAWMTGPLFAAQGASYLIHPLEMLRYVLIGCAGMFALAALGAASLRSTTLRLGLAALLILLSIRPALHAIKDSSEAAWGAAAALAIQQAAPGERIAVVPAFDVYVVRYYLPASRRGAAVEQSSGCGPQRIAIFRGRSWLPADLTARVTACYPFVIKRLHGVEVRSR